MTGPLQMSFEVDCPAEHAFRVWTAGIGTWWPADHTVTGEAGLTVMLQGRVGGRIYERTPDGAEHDWGEVTVWDPPSRLVYQWHLRRDRADATEVEIRFLAAGSGQTRIDIEHRGWERLGRGADEWRERNQAGWDTLLPHYQAAVEADARDQAVSQLAGAGFGRLAIAAAVITTLDDGRPHGSTGMAWAEHATPPLLLTTLHRDGRTRALVAAAGRFGVNLLSEEQRAYAGRFASRSADPATRFDGVPFTPGPAYGLPLLDGCLASFECEVQDNFPFGGHDIVVGRVAWAATGAPGQPVIHYDGHLWGLREPG
jgi:flavin reductase (DIM6/NTAB) family NADH-FMN oxidoreductase RutF/uncharacterized protein YndB with AHSA1/START domain